MGLFGFAGKVIGGVAKVGVGVAGMVVEGAVDKVMRVDEVRRSSSNLSDDELIRRSKSKSYSTTDRLGYRAAYRDRYSEDDD